MANIWRAAACLCVLLLSTGERTAAFTAGLSVGPYKVRVVACLEAECLCFYTNSHV